MPADVIHEQARDTPIVARTDVLVVGGGPAGVCAAVTAARLGARVILTERYGHLGGLASGGLTQSPVITAQPTDWPKCRSSIAWPTDSNAP